MKDRVTIKFRARVRVWDRFRVGAVVRAKVGSKLVLWLRLGFKVSVSVRVRVSVRKTVRLRVMIMVRDKVRARF